jgi:hypothetical protein
MFILKFSQTSQSMARFNFNGIASASKFEGMCNRDEVAEEHTFRLIIIQIRFQSNLSWVRGLVVCPGLVTRGRTNQSVYIESWQNLAPRWQCRLFPRPGVPTSTTRHLSSPLLRGTLNLSMIQIADLLGKKAKCVITLCLPLPEIFYWKHLGGL